MNGEGKYRKYWLTEFWNDETSVSRSKHSHSYATCVFMNNKHSSDFWFDTPLWCLLWQKVGGRKTNLHSDKATLNVRLSRWPSDLLFATSRQTSESAEPFFVSSRQTPATSCIGGHGDCVLIAVQWITAGVFMCWPSHHNVQRRMWQASRDGRLKFVRSVLQ